MHNIMGTHFFSLDGLSSSAPCAISTQQLNNLSITLLSTNDSELHNSLLKFRQLDEVNLPSNMSVENNFVKKFSRSHILGMKMVVTWFYSVSKKINHFWALLQMNKAFRHLKESFKFFLNYRRYILII